MTIRRGLSGALIALALSAAPHALAQNNKVAAEALFDEGKRLVKEGKYAEAAWAV